MKKVFIFKAKKEDEYIKVVEMKEFTFVSIGKKIAKLPYDFEASISFLKRLKMI